MTNPIKHLRRLISALLLLAVAACLVLPGAAGANPAGDSLGDVRQRLDDLLAGLKKQNSLTKSQLTALRRDLTSISFDLGTIQDDVNESYRQRGGHNGDQGDDNDHGHDGNDHNGGGGHDWHNGQGSDPGKGWDDFTNANVNVNPSYATFDGWMASRKFDVRIDAARRKLNFTVSNDTYRADWVIDVAGFDSPQVKVAQQGDSDLVLTVSDGRQSEDLLIQQGGLGPIYVRNGKNAPPPPQKWVPNPMAWLQPYDDQVRTGALGKSAGMDWFAKMVASDKYDPLALAELGRYLRNSLPQDPRGEIAILQYVSSKLPKQLSIPDPRSNVTGFVYAMDKALALKNSNKSFSIVMK